jgi:hypothetical protein
VSTSTMDPTVSALTPLISQIMKEIKNNNLSISDLSSLFTQFIQEKKRAAISDLDITSLLLEITEKNTENTLTAAEVSNLWNQYMGDSLSICIYKYFLNTNKNKHIRPILEFALQLAEGHIKKITHFFEGANFAVPIGFTEGDVNLNAPPLYTDDFLLFYSEIMTIHGLTAYSLAITTSERKDIQNYFFECTVTSRELFQKIVDLSKTLPKFSGAPFIPPRHGVEFIDKTGIISNLFGEKGPMNVSEINSLYFNSKKTGFVRSLCLGFSQVADSEEVRKFMLKNIELAGKDADSFDALLEKDYLPIPRKWDADVTDSTESPFSDKLMMFHAAFLVSAALSYYGAGTGASLRSDIILNYSQVFSHAKQAGAECFNIMVKHGWLEKQPQAIDRKALAQGENK